MTGCRVVASRLQLPARQGLQLRSPLLGPLNQFLQHRLGLGVAATDHHQPSLRQAIQITYVGPQWRRQGEALITLPSKDARASLQTPALPAATQLPGALRIADGLAGIPGQKRQLPCL